MWNGREFGVGEMMFGNVRVRGVKLDAAKGALWLRAVYDEREYMDIVYRDVFYTQLNEACAGISITLAQRADAAELKLARHRCGVLRLMQECGCSSHLVLDEMESRGYRFYAHYAGRDEEYLVIARAVSVAQR